MDANQAREEIRDIVNDIITVKNVVMSIAEQEELLEDICNDVLGYGPLEPLLARDDIADIMVNGPSQVFIEVGGKVEETDIRFRDGTQLLNICQRIVSQVGRRVDESSPICDARLPDGSRVNVIAPPLAIDGASLTIRKFKKDKLTLDQLVQFGSITPEGATILQIIGRVRCNVIVSGGTGSGKTTLLNCLTRYIDADERVITCEDAAELQLQQPHVVRLETRPPNLEGEGETGSVDVEERHLLARSAVARSSVVFVVGRAGMQGLFGQVRLIGELLTVGVPVDRLVPVVSRGPRGPRQRAELTVALREGKNREIRNVLGALGLKVNRLIRTMARDEGELAIVLALGFALIPVTLSTLPLMDRMLALRRVPLFRELSPAWLNYVAAINGCQPRPLDPGFTYMELGCGLGPPPNNVCDGMTHAMIETFRYPFLSNPVPVGASLVTSFLLYALLYGAALSKSTSIRPATIPSTPESDTITTLANRPPLRGFWELYPTFLTLYWMTAPLASVTVPSSVDVVVCAAATVFSKTERDRRKAGSSRSMRSL